MMTKETIAPVLDLRAMSRDSDTCLTQVSLFPDWDSKNGFVWIQAGQTSLRQKRNGDPIFGHTLTCYLNKGATDVEHDSAYLFQLPLVGLTFVSLFYHQVTFGAYIDPTLDTSYDGDRFSVPNPDYDPFKEADRCKSCKGKEAHKFVPYLPPNNMALYQKIKGMRVEVVVSPVMPDE